MTTIQPTTQKGPAVTTQILQRGFAFDELEVGMVFDCGQVTVTETLVQLTCSMFGDTSPLHSSDSAARAAGFDGRIAPGILTAALTLAPVSKISGRFGVTHFKDELTYNAPVYIGDVLDITVAVADLAPKSRFGVVTYRHEAHNSTGERVVEVVSGIAHSYLDKTAVQIDGAGSSTQGMEK